MEDELEDMWQKYNCCYDFVDLYGEGYIENLIVELY